MTGRPGASSRGRGGKFRKFTRGGGKHFSRDLRPVDADGNEISMWSEEAQQHGAGPSDEDEDEEESEEEEDDSDDAGPSRGQQEPQGVTREQRKADKKARKDAAAAKAKGTAVQVGDMPPTDSEEDSGDDLPANPNHSKNSRGQTKSMDVDAAANGIKDLSVSGTPSRREREALAAKEANRPTEADLARARQVRRQREAEAVEEAARRQAEKEEKEEKARAKRAELEAKEARKKEFALKRAKKGRA